MYISFNDIFSCIYIHNWYLCISFIQQISVHHKLLHSCYQLEEYFSITTTNYYVLYSRDVQKSWFTLICYWIFILLCGKHHMICLIIISKTGNTVPTPIFINHFLRNRCILLMQNIIAMANKDICIFQERSSTRLFDLFWYLDPNCVVISNGNIYEVVHINICAKKENT